MKRLTFLFIITCILFGVSAFYNPLMENYQNDLPTQLRQLLEKFTQERPSERLYLHVDKPLYRPGETIWFQAYLRQTADMRASALSDIIKVELIGPRGNTEKEFALIATDGVASGDITLSEEANGGVYTLKAYTEWQKNDKTPLFFEKEIQVQKVVLPRLKMKLDFAKEAYGAGEEATATVSLEKLNNQPLANHPFTYQLKIEGRTVEKGKGTTDAAGNASIVSKLPERLESPDGLLLVMLTHNGQTESISRSVPIVLNRFQVDIFPEGGDLVAGVPGKVAYRILDEFGKPADAAGKVVNQRGDEIATFESFHQGMGTFNLTPQEGETYRLKITQPNDVTQEWVLPSVLSKGYTLALAEQTNESVTLRVNAPFTETLTLMARVRGTVQASALLTVKQGDNLLKLNTTEFPIGVAQFTLFDTKGIERAERLAFVNRYKKLNISIQPNKEKLQPREKVTLDITVTDERGIPVPGKFSLAVVDDKLLSFTDDKSGRILSKLLLEPDLQGELFEPNFYFDESEEKSLAALDLLMLTQGWRRFTWQEIRDGITPPSIAAEKAIIAGKVIRYGQIVPNVKITVKPDNVSVRTNDKGEFNIEGIQLYEPKTLELYTKKGKEREVSVASYSQEMVIELQPPQMRPMARNRVLGDAPVAEQEMMMMEAADEALVERVNEVFDKGNVELLAVVVEPEEDIAPEDFADFGDFDEEPFAEEVAAAMDIPKVKPEEPTPITYYRAREFPTPTYKPEETSETRTDFRSTIFWKGNITTDRSGKASVSFHTSDEITAFRAILEGIGYEGTVGSGEAVFYNELPFSMAVKIPVAVTMGDKVLIPLTLTNNTAKTIEGKLAFTHPTAWLTNGKFPEEISLAANETKTYFLPYAVQNQPGKGTLAVAFSGNGMKDAFEQEVNTAPKGFPVSLAFSAQTDQTFSFEVANLVAGTLEARLTAYPSMLSDLLKGIESILREPYGCFEQTSSSTYPNLLVKRYLETSGIENATASARATKLIETGYDRLVSFETEENGYEWFGGTPAHEALTAYGLMEFQEMSQVYNGVSEEMVKRTANWLLSRKDGAGGFKQDPKALDSFGRADDDITNAYIVYALSEAGYTFEIREELEAALERAQESKDPYQMALITNALFNVKDMRAERLLSQLQDLQEENGSWIGLKHSITHSTGMGLRIETTSLAIMAHLKSDDPRRSAVEKAATFLVESRSPYGGFGNSQSTIMALRALTDYAAFSRRTQEDGSIEVRQNGKTIASKAYAAGEQDAIVLAGIESYLNDGKNVLSVAYPNVEHPLPYTLSVLYHSNQPNSSDSCQVALETTLADGKVKMGETVRLSTTLINKTNDGLPMTLAVVGIPGGLTPQPWQLKELQEKGVVDFYEITDRQVVFYYRQMKPNQIREINLDLKADIPGTYQAAASSAYLYYTNEHKTWVAGHNIQITD